MKPQSRTELLEDRIKELEKKLEENRLEIDQLRNQCTNTRRLYEQTKKSEKIYRSIIDSSADAIAIFDLHGKVRYVSPSFTQVFGWSMAEVEGRHIPFLPESEKEKTTALIIDLTLQGTPCHGLETRRYKKDGSLLDVSLSASRFHDHEGKPEGMFLILHDISERKKLQKQLLQAQKMQALGTLAGGIAHDFNNIIFNIIGYTEMTLADVKHNAIAQQNHEEVLKAATRARELVKHILTFSRHQVGDRKPILVQPVIEEALNLLRATIPATITIEQQIVAGSSPILADPTQIHQVIMNLGTNAFHAMRGTSGKLSLTVDERLVAPGDELFAPSLEPGRYVRICMRDTGHGMDGTVKDRIFEPFYTTKGPGDGTGLGLSVVHGIVKEYQGQVMVKSEPGKGTTFEIFLPTIDAQPLPENQSPLGSDLPKGAEHILVVDDEEQNVGMLRQMLERMGYRITGRTSGSDALQAFKEQPASFDLVITDLNMPGIPGNRLARELSEVRPDIPIILCTGFSETLSETEIKSLGIRHIIMKPAVAGEIAFAIRKVLDSDPAPLSPPLILVVDDDSTMRIMLEQHLKESGYRVIPAENGIPALEVLRSEKVNLVITDVRMPEMDGFELMMHLNAEFPDIPVVVMSAYGTPEMVQKFESLGSLQVLDKPIDLEALNRKIDESLRQSSQGGTMSGISVSNFLQLIGMEQKSCVLEIHGRGSRKGILYFHQGALHEAACGTNFGRAAALDMIAWENVLLKFRPLPQKKIKNRIREDLKSLLLESLRLKDENSRPNPVPLLRRA